MSKKRNADHKSLADALKDFIQENRLESGLEKVNAAKAWKEVMGPAILAYTNHVELKGNKLFIQLNSSVLREELSYGTSLIIKNLNQHLGKEIIQELVLR